MFPLLKLIRDLLCWCWFLVWIYVSHIWIFLCSYINTAKFCYLPMSIWFKSSIFITLKTFIDSHYFFFYVYFNMLSHCGSISSMGRLVGSASITQLNELWKMEILFELALGSVKCCWHFNWTLKYTCCIFVGTVNLLLLTTWKVQ